MIGIGNENWMEPYLERYAKFHAVLKAKHPEIQLVSSSGPSPSDERFDFAWRKLRELRADIVDEHCYASPVWFLSEAHRFDRYDRNGPKVFFGEYAAQSDRIASVNNRNNWACALAEAAFMTGMERNADVVRMASYAPLFAHAEAWQWTPDLIWVDNLEVARTPNYYVQQLFMRHRGDVVLPVQSSAVTGPTTATGGIELTTYRGSAEFKDITVNVNGQAAFMQAHATNRFRSSDPQWRDYTLSLKARKTGGAEGFLIRVRDEQPGTYVQWNLGGWGNTRHGIQSELGLQGSLISQVPGRIEADRWYDVRIELLGSQVRCYLDGQLVQSAEVKLPRREGVFASAVRDERSGEIILKVANVGPAAQTADIRLAGVKKVTAAHAIKLLGAPNDENQLGAAETVTPQRQTLKLRSSQFRQEFAPNSFTVLRLKTK
jgi:alpha-L-arabinofuranosidase